MKRCQGCAERLNDGCEVWRDALWDLGTVDLRGVLLYLCDVRVVQGTATGMCTDAMIVAGNGRYIEVYTEKVRTTAK